MKPSADIKAALLRAYAAHSLPDPTAMLNCMSREEGVLAIGSDPSEWWAGFETIARVYRAQLPEMGGQVEIKSGDIQAYAEGTVGWAADRTILCALGQEIPMRVTAVFHLEDGEWKIVQEHASIGVQNSEVLGKELTT